VTDVVLPWFGFAGTTDRTAILLHDPSVSFADSSPYAGELWVRYKKWYCPAGVTLFPLFDTLGRPLILTCFQADSIRIYGEK